MATKKRHTYLTDEQVLKGLKQIRDKTLKWWLVLTDTQRAQGTGAASDGFRKAQDEVIRAEDRINENKEVAQLSGKIELIFKKSEPIVVVDPPEEEVKQDDKPKE